MFETKFRRVISGTLVFAFTMGLLGISGCSKNGGSESPTETLAPGALVSSQAAEKFYTVNSFYSPCEGKPGAWGVGNKPVYVDDDLMIIPEVFAIGEQDGINQGEDDDIYRYCVYSLKDENFGEVINTIDYKSLHLPSNDGSDGENIIVSGIEDVAYVNDESSGKNILQCIVSVSEYPTDYSRFDLYYRIYKVDIETGEVIYQSENLDLNFFNRDAEKITDISVYDDKYYMLVCPWNGAKFKVLVLDMNLQLQETSSVDALSTEGIKYVNKLEYTDNTTILIMGTDVRDNEKTYIYNVQEQTISSIENQSVFSVEDALWSKNYMVTADGFSISQKDMLTGEELEAVDYNRCIINRNDINSGMAILAVNEGEFICQVMDSEHGYKYLVFSPTDVNPYENKSAISLAVLDENTSPEINDAIYKFNCESDDAYIYVDTRYIINREADIDPNNHYAAYIYSDEYRDAIRNATSMVTNQMMVDIIAGEGPDIIVNGYNYSQFNNSYVMVDLNSYIDSTLKREDYFKGVFYTNTDGLYQFPYSVSFMTMVGYEDTVNYRNDNYGIDYDTYSKFVSEYCNGMDPLLLEHSRTSYFLLLFNTCRNKFIKNGKISLDSDDFRSLAKYCKELPDLVPDYDEYYNQMSINGVRASYGYNSIDEGWHFLALPTAVGAPAQLSCGGSVGITTSCQDVDVAWSFVETLLSDDVQNEVLSIKKSIREQQLQDSWDEWNDFCDNYYDVMDPTSKPPRRSSDCVKETMHVLECAESVYSSDSDIDKILYEEIQAYFAGQKNLDQVIEIMENRCQTVLDERG